MSVIAEDMLKQPTSTEKLLLTHGAGAEYL